MLPKILEYEDGRIKVTAEAFTIPELHSIITKFGDNAEPYLAYVSALSRPDSSYNYIPESEKEEAALFDIKETLGEFDETDDLIQPAIERLRSLWESAQTQLADEMEEELHRWRKYLKETPMGGEAMKDRLVMVDKIEKVSLAAANIRKIADNEIGPKMKGSNELGEY